jgi:hypothetical protein
MLQQHSATQVIYQDEGTHVFGCKHTSCKRYYNLPFVAADAAAAQCNKSHLPR